ncbi:MAG: glycosyltransferase family 2 protein [Bacteroidales bacterium]|nr:glycosyltransferase family 2 protein [Bacteroidales bacterium]
MGFADHYLDRQQIFFSPEFIAHKYDAACIIVIPCYNEDKLLLTLESLWKCQRPYRKTGVIIVVNSSTEDSGHVLKRNSDTIAEFIDWEKHHQDKSLWFSHIHATALPKKHAGAGLARKIGMDAAVSVFNSSGNSNGVIVSLDADCTCSENYLREIEKGFTENNSAGCAILYFEHPVSGKDFENDVYEAVVQYELHLRYHVEYLRYIGYPFAYHTVGSCFALRADAYVKAGGMNRRQAGEDFYFLNKVFAANKIIELNNLTVYPSPRPSDRVVFGTGPVIKRMTGNREKTLLTYNPESYNALKDFIEMIPRFYGQDLSAILKEIRSLPDAVVSYLLQLNPEGKISEIKQNTGSEAAFIKRFYNWFNPLMVVKYLNFSHMRHYQMVPVMEASHQLIERLGMDSESVSSPLETLNILREKQSCINNAN